MRTIFDPRPLVKSNIPPFVVLRARGRRMPLHPGRLDWAAQSYGELEDGCLLEDGRLLDPAASSRTGACRTTGPGAVTASSEG
jgi:hypothetical protein